MIPEIVHSRSQLVSYVNEYDDGAISLVVSSDTYPELFSFKFPEIVAKAPNGWRYKTMAYLWFPADALDEEETGCIDAWRTRFEQYVLLGLNSHIEDFFTDELDYCMALDLNRIPSTEMRTFWGEAEYQFKYCDSHQHFDLLRGALVRATSDLPIPPAYADSYCISCVPGAPEKSSVQCQLAMAVADELDLDFIDADLNCPKPELKGVTVEDKLPIWQELYDDGCIELSDSVEGRLVVVIDDLYQSGATLWTYAKFLKDQGANHVIGLPCVKSLRDSDNQ